MNKIVMPFFLKLIALSMMFYGVSANAADASPTNTASVCAVPPSGWGCVGTSIGCACFKTTEPTKCSCPPGWVHTARAVAAPARGAREAATDDLSDCACSEWHSGSGSVAGAPAAAPAATSRGAPAVTPSARAPHRFNVQILSATVKDKKIDGATVTLQKNGEQSATALTDTQGQASLNASFADDTSALLIIKKAGFSNLVVKCPCAGMTYAISPAMTNLDGMRIVLNWGAEPRDLDAHLFVFQVGDVLLDHTFFSSKAIPNYANHLHMPDQLLDVDDTDGFGPETITINRIRHGMRYVYAVHNFVDASALSKSDAKVFVYVGETLIKTYYVPAGIGNLWTVFAITETGEFQDVNTIQALASNVGPGSYGLQQVIANRETMHLKVERESYAQQALASNSSADELNKNGESAYHAGNLDESIRLYQTAIELDGNFGQAYSNLGLAFQKAGRVAEAMWANRKAIALASGPTAATVRASSHFNNGKIYETAGQWSDALREYQYAKSEKSNPIYDKAIQRMQEKK